MEIKEKLKVIERDLLEIVDYVGILARRNPQSKITALTLLIRITNDIATLKHSLQSLQVLIIEDERIKNGEPV
jgi:hypothetical protein